MYMYLNFMFLDQFLFECAKTHTQKLKHIDSDEYSIVAFCKKSNYNHQAYTT